MLALSTLLSYAIQTSYQDWCSLTLVLELHALQFPFLTYPFQISLIKAKDISLLILDWMIVQELYLLNSHILSIDQL